jgi:hypothetical protein
MSGVARHVLLVALVLGVAGCSPVALAPEEIVPAFIAASQDAARTMRMEWQGTMALGQSGDPAIDPMVTDQSMNATFDFNGSDFAGTMVTGFAGSNTSTSYARISGVAFINYGESGWQRADSFGGQNVVPDMDLFHGLTAADVVYEAVDSLDGRQVHRLRVLDPLTAFSGGQFATGGEIDRSLTEAGPSEFLIYVDANAIPVGAHVALDMSMNWIAPEVNEGMKFSYEIRFDYTFSLWGEPVTISPPQVTNGGFDDFLDGQPRQ